MASPAASESAPLPWVILGSIPRVAVPSDGDISLALMAPPRVSILTVSPQVFPGLPTPHHFPFLLAADPGSGLLLLQASQPRGRMVREVVDRADQQSLAWSDTVPRYFVLDATASPAPTAFHLPEPHLEPIQHQALLGLIADPAGAGHYTVAELLPVIGSDEASLRCFSSQVGEWVDKRVHYPLPPRPLVPIGVVSHQGRLWWIDLSWGVIAADPCADKPVLRFVSFPAATVLGCREGWGITDLYRHVGVSAGKLRFVDTYMTDASAGAPKITIWTLPSRDSTEWTLEHEAKFRDIWADRSYKATGLPKKVPVIALIHPKNPAVVFFFLEKRIFGVEVRARKVTECNEYDLIAPPRGYIASRFVRAWELPPSLSSVFMAVEPKIFSLLQLK